MKLSQLLWVALSVVGSVGNARSQEFEVASFKVRKEPTFLIHPPSLRNGAFRAENVTMGQLLGAAFGLEEGRISGPSWLYTDRFDVAARSTSGASDKEMGPMLLGLLRERLHMKFRREQRELAVFNLVAAKGGGGKMKAFPGPEPPEPEYPHGFPQMRGTMTMPQLAERLSHFAGRPVFDETGLGDRRYKVLLTFAPMVLREGQSQEFAPPDIFKALTEQLGLQLRPAKKSVEVVVIESIDRTPEEN